MITIASSPLLALIVWLSYYSHHSRVCMERRTMAGCDRFISLERFACDHGVGESFLVGGCFALMRRNEVGVGLPKDPQQATAYARRACVASYGRGCTLAWSWYGTAFGTPHEIMMWGGPTGPSPSQAYLPQFARDLDDVLADAAALCASDFREGVAQSGRHHELLRRFCDDLTRARAARNDARAHLLELVQQCESQSPGACAIAGQLLTFGIGVNRDMMRGKALLTRACREGIATACYDAGLEKDHPSVSLRQLEEAERLTR